MVGCKAMVEAFEVISSADAGLADDYFFGNLVNSITTYIVATVRCWWGSNDGLAMRTAVENEAIAKRHLAKHLDSDCRNIAIFPSNSPDGDAKLLQLIFSAALGKQYVHDKALNQAREELAFVDEETFQKQVEEGEFARCKIALPNRCYVWWFPEGIPVAEAAKQLSLNQFDLVVKCVDNRGTRTVDALAAETAMLLEPTMLDKSVLLVIDLPEATRLVNVLHKVRAKLAVCCNGNTIPTVSWFRVSTDTLNAAGGPAFLHLLQSFLSTNVCCDVDEPSSSTQ